MILTFTLYDILVVVATIGGIYLLYELFNYIIFPWLVNKKTKDIEKNPKWIVPELQNKYYGFRDIDIITVNSPLGMLPRFRIDKKKKDRLQLLIPEDTSTKDIDNIAQLALAGKLRIKYGVWHPDKSAHWLAILNFMLDGGDIRVEATKWDENHKTND